MSKIQADIILLCVLSELIKNKTIPLLSPRQAYIAQLYGLVSEDLQTSNGTEKK